MSAEAGGAAALAGGPGVGVALETRAPSPEVRRRRAQVFRLAFGMTFSAGIAFFIAWPLAFVTPVLVAKLLSLPKLPPPRAGVMLVGILSASFLLSAWVLLPTVRYPVAHLLLMGLILFHLFYAKAGGANPILVVFALVGVMAIPLVGSVSQALSEAAALGLSFGAVVAVGVVYLAAALFPDPSDMGPTVARSEASTKAGEGKPEPLPQKVRIGLALRSWAVIFPLYALFQFFSAVDQAVVLIFAALMSLEPRFGRHWAAGKGLILTNLVGGLVAVILFTLLVWVPAYAFFLLLITLAGLVVGRLIFSDSPLGKLLAGGITTVFVVLGPTLTGEEEAGAKLYIRVLQIMSAVLYVVVAFGIMERLTRGRRIEA